MRVLRIPDHPAVDGPTSTDLRAGVPPAPRAPCGGPGRCEDHGAPRCVSRRSAATATVSATGGSSPGAITGGSAHGTTCAAHERPSDGCGRSRRALLACAPAFCSSLSRIPCDSGAQSSAPRRYRWGALVGGACLDAGRSLRGGQHLGGKDVSCLEHFNTE